MTLVNESQKEFFIRAEKLSLLFFFHFDPLGVASLESSLAERPSDTEAPSPHDAQRDGIGLHVTIQPLPLVESVDHVITMVPHSDKVSSALQVVPDPGRWEHHTRGGRSQPASWPSQGRCPSIGQGPCH